MKPICWLILSLIICRTTVAQKKYRPGKVFRDCAACPEMVVIPAGHFMIGTPAGEAGRDLQEGPQQEISISQFAAGRFDITRGQWAAFVSATNRSSSGGCAWSGLPGAKPWEANPAASWNHLGFPQDDSHPVVCITWNDAEDYVHWLTQQTGNNYRLLTESEWEYAARAGTVTAFAWGTAANHEYANYGADSGYSGLASGRDQWMSTSPVGSFPPNAFGLYDMQGNVLQFVEDCFSDSYRDIPLNGSAYNKDIVLNLSGELADLTGKNACSLRMVRGSDFGDPPRMLRSGFRNWAPGPGSALSSYRSAGLGFRVARTL